MADLNGGRAVVDILKAEGVRYIFGIVGSTFLDVLDALYDDRTIEYVNVRHEQAAAFMADGLSRVTDLPGVCLVTSGPGATNLLTGVAAAHVAHSPVVVLVGGISLDHAQKDAFQEYDLVSMFKPVTKLALQITRPERIPDLLRAALRAAMTRPARAGAGRDPPRRAERAAGPGRAPGGDGLPRHASAAATSGGDPRRRASAAPGRAAAAHRRRRCQPRGRRRSGRQAERAVRHPGDHRLRPQRRGAERAPALHRAAGAGGRAGGRGGLPPGRSILAVGSRLGAVHHALRRSLHPSRRAARADRRREPRHRPLLSGRRRHPGRRARGDASRCSTRSAPTARRRRAAWRQEAEAFRAQRQARLAGEAKLDASRSSPSACTRSCGGCCRPTRSSRWTPAPRRPTATTACSSAGRRPSSRRWISAVSASRFRSRWAPSLAGPSRRWWRSTATAATS